MEKHGLEPFFNRQNEKIKLIEQAESSGCLTVRQLRGDLASYMNIGSAMDAYDPLLVNDGKAEALSMAARQYQVNFGELLKNYFVVIEPSERIPLDGDVWVKRRPETR